MTDAETTAAIEALAYRLRTRDAAMNDGEDYADPEVFAAEYLTAMRGRGWRVTNTAPPPVHDDGAGLPTRDDVQAVIAEFRARYAAGATIEPDGAA